MAANRVESPFPILFDADGGPLNNGYVYVGIVNLDPESSPRSVYWDQALTVLAAQPVRTINGYFSQNGSPGKLFTDADDYSMTVKNKNLVQVYSSLANTDVSATTPMSSVTGQLESDRVDFTQTSTGAVERTVEDKFQDRVSVKDFGALGDGANDDTVEIQAALDSISAGRVYFPAGTYNVTAPLQIRTTDMVVKGDSGGTVIEAQAGFSGTSVIAMEDSSNCVLEDLVVDANSQVNNGVNIDDGISVAINRVLVKNCSAIGFRIQNVNSCVLTACGAHTVGNAAFDFLASAALDAVSTVADGIDCRLIDCYSTAAGASAGTIYSDQVDTSSIDVMVERFKEISNTGAVSVGSGTVHLDHKVQLIDCELLDPVTSIAVIFQAANSIRTIGIAINESSETAIAQLSSPFGGATEYGGLLSIMVSTTEISAGSADMSAYTIFVNSTNGAVTVAQNEPVHNVLVTLNIGTGQLECLADTVGDAGTYYFHVTQLGGIGLANL